MQRILTPYGYDNAFLMLGVALAIASLGFAPLWPIAKALCFGFGAFIFAFTMWFFRDAERPLNASAAGNSAIIIAPADGQVVNVTPVDNSPELGCAAVQISIFLSPVNLHVNRYPASGTIRKVTYFPGKYLMAFNPKSSQENERSQFVLETEHGLICYQQITGFLARRIVYDTQEGDVVTAGDRFGMMKFGSRMDVVVPATAAVYVRPGQKVVSSATILADMRGTAA
ncbi:MAG: phosphatidylserine decarboxylase [Ignavibacteria bacterium]|jgi:phosphatidylserine decarboxylase